MATSVLSRHRRQSAGVPEAYRNNFHHLYWDIAWYGLLAGSSIAFLAVYAARIGATALEIGLLTAGPAAMSLLVTMPLGQWLSHPISGPERLSGWRCFLPRRLLFLDLCPPTRY